MLNVCGLLWRSKMPLETLGAKATPFLDHTSMTLYDVFEKFVANFYRSRLKGWTVRSQVPMSWNAERDSLFLPGLKLDLRLQHQKSARLVMLDTKFTASSMVVSRMGNKVFNSEHLYQLYAYLRSQEELSEVQRNATGILLYPRVQEELDETIILQSHPIRVVTIDLAQPWRDVEKKLLDLFT
jgi:5-methylcytosine-specific restriction enzyme subunit McrC